MSLRGIFDGGGVRKQNGHWQSSLKGKKANGIFHYTAYNDYFYGPAVWKKFNYGDAININQTFHFELVRTGQDDWSDYLGGVGISKIFTDVQNLTQPKIVQKPDGGSYRIVRSGDEGSSYVIIERDANDVVLNRYELDICCLNIRSADMDYGTFIRRLISTNTAAKTYHIDYSAVYEYNNQYCTRVRHTPYVNGQAGTASYVYEPISYGVGTLVMTPDPYMYSSTERFVNGGGAKMVSGSWPASFDMNVELQVPAFDTSGASLYSELVSLIDVPMSTNLCLNYYMEGTAISSGHFITKVYIT